MHISTPRPLNRYDALPESANAMTHHADIPPQPTRMATYALLALFTGVLMLNGCDNTAPDLSSVPIEQAAPTAPLDDAALPSPATPPTEVIEPTQPASTMVPLPPAQDSPNAEPVPVTPPKS